jgi:hypothetical protein
VQQQIPFGDDKPKRQQQQQLQLQLQLQVQQQQPMRGFFTTFRMTAGWGVMVGLE